MLKVLRTRNRSDVAFCDRCASVCDAGCRADAIRTRNVERALRYGWRLV